MQNYESIELDRQSRSQLQIGYSTSYIKTLIAFLHQNLNICKKIVHYFGRVFAEHRHILDSHGALSKITDFTTLDAASDQIFSIEVN